MKGLAGNKRTFIIAEAGVNHNGSEAIAEQLVAAAADAGADAIKFQTFKAADGVSRFAEKASYQKHEVGGPESQLEMVRKLELPFDAFGRLKARCERLGIQFLTTAFDLGSVAYVESLDLPMLKVPSGELTNLPLLRKIDECHKPVLMSTGMATRDEIAAAISVLKHSDITLLHCTTEYPCPFDSVNLKAIQTLRDTFGLPVGYSDHTSGIEIPIAAVALGACCIEKHFTLDRGMVGPDHRASIEPQDLARMVKAIRNLEMAMGDGIKKPERAEIKNIMIVRKSIVARRRIAKGEVFTDENLAAKRPGTGISPMEWDRIVGMRANKDYEEDEQICGV